MVGRGGLPRRTDGIVDNDQGQLRVIEVKQQVADMQIGTEDVVDGTDVLTVRGALRSPVFRVDAADPAAFVIAGNTATLQIDEWTTSAFRQPLGSLHALYNEGTGTTTPEAILLVGSQGDTVFAVVEMTEIEFSTVTLDVQNQSRQVDRARLTLSINANAGGHAEDYLEIGDPSGNFPPNLTTVSFASVIEEYQFFVREDFTIPGDVTSQPSPKLARARVFPGTDPPELHPDGVIDIADNVFDLQVALGIDLDGNGRIDVEDGGGTPLDPIADEWMWNAPVEDDSLTWNSSSLQHVRLTIAGQAQTADRTYVSPALTSIENHVYDEPTDPSGGELVSRRHRRRSLQSTIDLRNL
jgi:hypothetical protein